MIVQRGFSLLEVVIASFLGLFILSLFTEIYSMVKYSFQQQKTISELLHKGRFVVYFFNETLKKAGLNTCNNLEGRKVYSKLQVRGKGERMTIYQCFRLNGTEIFLPVEYFLENNNLYYKPNVSFYSKQPLIYSVEKMEILYGVACKTEVGVCDYLMADAVNDWKTVRSISMKFSFLEKKTLRKWHLYAVLPERGLDEKKQDWKEV